MTKTIIENGVRVYEGHFCKHCEERIPYPNSKRVARQHKLHGVPQYCQGHNPNSRKGSFKKGHKTSKQIRQKMSKAHLGVPRPDLRGKNHPQWIDGYGQERGNSKRKGLGFVPLNRKTKIANTMHHLDNKHVVFIPSELHEDNFHRLKNKESMKKMNALALEWCEEHNPIKVKFEQSQRNLLSF